MPSARFKTSIPASEHPQTYVLLGYGNTGVRNDTTQQSGQTPDKEVEIKIIIVYVSGYTGTWGDNFPVVSVSV